MNKFGILLTLLLAACSYQIKIKTGDQAFQSKQYANAIGFYKNEIDQVSSPKEKAFKAFKLGQSYKYLSDYDQSLGWFKKAYDWNYGLKALEEYAIALKNTGDYEAAILAYQELMQELKGGMEYKKDIQICKLNLEWIKQRTDFYYKLTNFTAVNDKASDYSALSVDSSKLYFVSDRLSETRHDNSKFGWTGRSFSDIYLFQNGLVVSLPEPINSQSNEGSFCFNSTGNKIYFTRCDANDQPEDYCKIYESEYINGSWGEPERLDLGFDNSNVYHPALYKSDSILVFSSNAPGGIGQYDLYLSYLGNEGWTVPENLGEPINSAYDEKFPVWYNDTLYFSSNGHPGLGGLDVFKTYKISDSKWTPPINLKPDINSEADDFGFFIDKSFVANDTVFQKALLSSNRNFNRQDEIYSVELRKRSQIPSIQGPKKFKWDVQANIQFVTAESYKSPKQIPVDSVDLIEKISKNSVNSKSNSRITLKLLPGDSYTFLASKKNYLNNEFSFTTPAQPELTADSLFILTLVVELIPIRYDEEFVIPELYYDFDKWNIRQDAVASLEKLRGLLNTNPLIRIRLGSHTDCRGDEKYNLELSEKRAHAAMQWLIAKGIDSNRLFHTGYGENDPAINCSCDSCSEDDHQKNRRTTFTLIR
ncbi:MAG: OmpA family protein [Saprospiraceae bacterium]|jgi:outer membrane protein OmpA-like peptidoglycan-associated protein/tetratricopeptide (TPR) repeat protein